MLPYWFMFVFSAWFALKPMSAVIGHHLDRRRWDFQWRMVFLFLILVIGFRHEVGGDWIAYQNHLDAGVQQLADILTQDDPAYALLNSLGAQGFGGVYFVNTVCALFFVWGLIAFCRLQSRPWLALLVAIPYLVIVVAMGYTRQGVAIGLAMLGLVALQRGQVWRFIFWVAFAATFHKTAVILLPLAIFVKGKSRFLTIIIAITSFYGLYSVFMHSSVDYFMQSYVESRYQSSGAGIRIFMNALPAMIFLKYKHRFVAMTSEQCYFWKWISWAALSLVLLLWISPSSTAVDRIALYCIPLQLVVWSHIPDVFGQPLRRNRKWEVIVVIYSASVLFVWLMFASNVFAWLPYKFYPWEVMWQ